MAGAAPYVAGGIMLVAAVAVVLGGTAIATSRLRRTTAGGLLSQLFRSR